MSRLVWYSRRLLSRLGWPPVIAAALLALIAAAYWAWLLPLQQNIADLRSEAEGLRLKVAARKTNAAPNPADQLNAFYAFFPVDDALTATLDAVYKAAAKENLTLQQGEYRLAPETEGKLQRYDLTLPVKGAYPSLRRFIAQVLKDVPAIALESISFNRQGVMDIGVDAQVRFTLYLRAETQ